MSDVHDVGHRLVERLAGLGARMSGAGQTLEAVVAGEHFPDACRAVLETGAARLCTMVASDERGQRDVYRLRYIFHLSVPPTFVALLGEAPAGDPAFPSLTPLLPAADWYEREARDLLGLLVAGHPDPRPLLQHAGWPPGYYPLRKDAPAAPPAAEVVVDVPEPALIGGGPLAAGIGETGWIGVTPDGARVGALAMRLFYGHRGLEKRAEGMDPAGVVELAERICGACSFAHALACCHAVEDAAGCEPPLRARTWRAVLLELERLRALAGDIGALAAAADRPRLARACYALRERLLALNQRLLGTRFPRGVVAPGGLRHDLPPAAPDLIAHVLAEVRRDWTATAARLLADAPLRHRLRGLGVLAPEVAALHGVVGPLAAGSGVPRDCRLALPHGAYLRHPPIPATTTAGDGEARLLARLHGIDDSFRLITLLLENLPGGPIAEPLDPLAAGAHGLGWAESARGEHVHWLAIGADSLVDRYRVRAASYCNWPMVPRLAAGSAIADLPLLLADLSLCVACVDR